MKDPITLGATVTAAPVLLGITHVAGMPVDAVVWGFFGGIVAVLAVPSSSPTPPRRGLALYLALATSLIVSVLVATAMGPLTAAYLHISTVDVALEVRAFSFLWGAGAQAGLLVTAIEALRRRIDQLGGSSGSSNAAPPNGSGKGAAP